MEKKISRALIIALVFGVIGLLIGWQIFASELKLTLLLGISDNTFQNLMSDIFLHGVREKVFWIAGISAILGFIVGLNKESSNQTKKVTKNIYQNDLIDKNTKVCPQCAETIKKEAQICRYCQYRFTEEELQIVVTDINKELKNKEKNELLSLHKMIESEKNKLFGGMTDEIQSCINELFLNQEKAIQLLYDYIELNQTDLIEELKELNSSYDAIKINLSKFIELNILDENFPHNRK